MPELPGPPAGYDEEQRRIWFEGAAAVARLQAQQWGIIADQYQKRAQRGDGDGDSSATTEVATSDDEGEDECPECDGQLVDGLGGEQCLNCGYEPN